MFKLFLLTLFIGACVARPAHPTPEEVQQDIDNFKANLQAKYEESKNAGRDGFQHFLNFLEEQKGCLDKHFEDYKEQQSKAEQMRLKIQDLTKYLKELKDKAVDDAVGWTQEASNKANEMWSQVSQYEKIPEERVIVRSRRDVESHAVDAYGDLKDAAKEAKDSAEEALEHAKARSHQTQEEIQKDIDDFKANLHVKYEETKNAGKDGFQRFLNYLQEQKGKLDEHFQEYKEQQAHAEEVRLKIQDMANYLKQLKDKAVDDALGWTQEASDAANNLWEQIKKYENLHDEKVVIRNRRDMAGHDDSASHHASQAWDHAKDAASKAWDNSKDSASSAAHHAGDAASRAWDASKDTVASAYDHAKKGMKSAVGANDHSPPSSFDHDSHTAHAAHHASVAAEHAKQGMRSAAHENRKAQEHLHEAERHADRAHHP